MGDLVKLNIGGPTMAIVSIEGPGNSLNEQLVECVWYEQEKCCRESFPLEALEAITTFEFCGGVSRPYFE